MPPSPLRAGLSGLVDYAGLFPPASLDLAAVVTRFAAYAESDEQWMLGRLIVPLPQLGPIGSLAQAFEARARRAWPLSVLVPGDAHLDDVGARVRRFNDTHDVRGVAVVAVELTASTADEVVRIGATVPSWLERYVEVPIGDELPGLLDAVKRAGCSAKVRTGGVTADRIPPAAALARFVREAVARGVPFKATAGLHHPLRDRYRLTYEPDSSWGTMHGFLNLVIAAALVRKDPGMNVETTCAVLEESEPAAFSIGRDAVAWREVALTTEDLVQARAHALRSVGSCSFEEPVSELRGLGWMPHQ